MIKYYIVKLTIIYYMEITTINTNFNNVIIKIILSLNKNNTNYDNKLTLFHSIKEPTISIFNYWNIILQKFRSSPECPVIVLIYMDRLIKKNYNMIINNLTIHRLILILTIIAIKYNDDMYMSNLYYATNGCVTLKELNRLEINILKLLNWKLYIGKKLYKKYLKKINKLVLD